MVNRYHFVTDNASPAKLSNSEVAKGSRLDRKTAFHHPTVRQSPHGEGQQVISDCCPRATSLMVFATQIDGAPIGFLAARPRASPDARRRRVARPVGAGPSPLTRHRHPQRRNRPEPSWPSAAQIAPPVPASRVSGSPG